MGARTQSAGGVPASPASLSGSPPSSAPSPRAAAWAWARSPGRTAAASWYLPLGLLHVRLGCVPGRGPGPYGLQDPAQGLGPPGARLQLQLGAAQGEVGAGHLGGHAHPRVPGLFLGRLGLGLGRLHLAPHPPEQVQLPGGVEFRIVDGDVPGQAGDLPDRQRAVEGLLLPGDAGPGVQGGPLAAGCGLPQGAGLPDPGLGLAQVQVAGEGGLLQAVQGGIAEAVPPGVQLGRRGVGGLGPALAGVHLGRGVVRADLAAQGQDGQDRGEGAETDHRAPHSSFPLTNQVARDRVARPMTAMGQALANTSRGGRAFRKLPCRITR